MAEKVSFLKTLSRNWVFTLNNWTPEDRTMLENLECKHIFFGEEVGEKCGTPHLQGFVSFEHKKSGKQMKQIHQNISWDVQKKCDLANKRYCSKGVNIFEKGDKPKGVGHRTDLDNYKEIAMKHENYRDYVEEIGPNYRSHYGQQMWEKYRKRYEYKLDELRPWQHELVEETKLEADDRSIIWYVDEKGGSGKTALSKHLMCEGALRIENGATKDIMYMYEGQKIVIMDLCRSNEMMTNYNVLESLKNGTRHSTKYVPVSSVHKPPHVIVFSNYHPDTTKLSMDRWKIRIL